MNSFKRLSPILFLSFLTACTPNLGPQVAVNESALKDFSLDAQSIDFISKHEGPTTNIYVNKLESSVAAWAKTHFKPSASQGQAIIEIDEIYGEDVPFPAENRDFLTTVQAGRLKGAIALKISIQNPRGFKEKYLEVRSNRSHTYPENATLVDKEKIWESVVNAIINSLNAKFKEALGE